MVAGRVGSDRIAVVLEGPAAVETPVVACRLKEDRRNSSSRCRLEKLVREEEHFGHSCYCLFGDARRLRANRCGYCFQGAMLWNVRCCQGR